MKKILVMPKNIETISRTSKYVDGYIIGIENLCINPSFCVNMGTIDVLRNLYGKELFININKNMTDDDLYKVKEYLLRLNNYHIKGIFVYDIGVFNLYKKLNLNYDIYWDQEHLTTNYASINYWNNEGFNGVHISNDITSEEIEEILDNVDCKTFMTVFGYIPMFSSKRHIVDNYLDYFKLSNKSKINYIEKEEKIYPIVDKYSGTICYSNNILNGIEAYLNLDIDYCILDNFNLDLSKFIKVLEMYRLVNKKNVHNYVDKIKKIFKNVDNGFLNTKTIYKVKK